MSNMINGHVYHVMVDGPTHDVWIALDHETGLHEVLAYSRGTYATQAEAEAARDREVASCAGRYCCAHNPSV